MSDNSGLLTLDNAVFRCFCLYSSILIVKMMLLTGLTGFHRFRKMVFCSPEDTKLLKRAKVRYNDPDVERVRAAHLSDVQNLILFVAVAFAHVRANPSPELTMLAIKVYAGVRIAHTYALALFSSATKFKMAAQLVEYSIVAFMLFKPLTNFGSAFGIAL